MKVFTVLLLIMSSLLFTFTNYHNVIKLSLIHWVTYECTLITVRTMDVEKGLKGHYDTLSDAGNLQWCVFCWYCYVYLIAQCYVPDQRGGAYCFCCRFHRR